MGAHFLLGFSVHTVPEPLRVACDSSFTEKSLKNWVQKGHMTPLEPSAVRSGFCWRDFNCSHLAITRLGPEIDCTPVGTELGDGEPSSDSQCLSLSPVVPDVLPLAF